MFNRSYQKARRSDPGEKPVQPAGAKAAGKRCSKKQRALKPKSPRLQGEQLELFPLMDVFPEAYE